jgi:hypothetical protein
MFPASTNDRGDDFAPFFIFGPDNAAVSHFRVETQRFLDLDRWAGEPEDILDRQRSRRRKGERTRGALQAGDGVRPADLHLQALRRA